MYSPIVHCVESKTIMQDFPLKMVFVKKTINLQLVRIPLSIVIGCLHNQ